jgi:hypothetical protein
MHTIRFLLRVCLIAVAIGAVLGSTVMVYAAPRDRVHLPPWTPALVSATGGGSIAVSDHRGHRPPVSLTQATGGGPLFPTRPIPVASPRPVEAPTPTEASPLVAVGFWLALAAVGVLLLHRRHMRRGLARA